MSESNLSTTTPQHTPTPWKVAKDAISQLPPDEFSALLCTVGATVGHHVEIQRATIAALVEALSHLRAEIHGALSIGEYGIREAIGNTNVACIQSAIAKADAALAAAKGTSK